MRTLQELQTLSRIALAHEPLVKIATSASSPNAAAEQATAEGWGEQEVKSCRWLAMVKREYGETGVIATLQIGHDQAGTDIFEQHVVPKILFLETLVGDFVMVVGADNESRRFIDYLRESRPADLDVHLKFGGFTAHLHRHHTNEVTGGMTLYRSSSTVKLESDQGVLTNIDYSTSGGKSKSDISSLQQSILWFIYEAIGGPTAMLLFSYPTLAMAVVNSFKARGEFFAEPLWKNQEVASLVRQGEIEKLKLLLHSIRISLVSDSATTRSLTCFDLDASQQIAEAERIHYCKDPNITLLQKVSRDKIRGWVEASVIPGAEEKHYNFFLYYGHGRRVSEYVRVLTLNGYGGSVVFSSFNQPSGFEVGQTGQVDGLLLDDNIGYSSKADWLDELQEHSGKQVPQFVWDGSNHRFDKDFADFLKKNFPLK
jgi:hypothetical protein